MDKEMLDAIRHVIIEVIPPLVKEEIAPLQKQVSGLQEQMTGMQKQVSGLQEQMTGMQKQFSEMQEEVTGLKLVTENDIRPSIKTIAEGHAGLAEKLSRIDDFKVELDEIKGSIAVVEAAVVKNKVSIIDLQKAKEI